MLPQLHSEECGMWGICVREGSIEGGRLWDGNLKLIPTPGVVESPADAKMRIFCQSFNILLFISGGQAGGLCSEWDGMSG